MIIYELRKYLYNLIFRRREFMLGCKSNMQKYVVFKYLRFSVKHTFYMDMERIFSLIMEKLERYSN